jgi:hypothetical protein
MNFGGVGSLEYRSMAAEHLDRLGSTLAECELAAVTRYAGLVPLLRVFHPALPCIGETVAAMPFQDGQGACVWWFVLPGYDFLARCSDLERTVERLFEALAPIIQVVTGQGGR